MTGFTIYLCFGRYAGFKVTRDGFVLRVILGWMSIGFMMRDIELWLEDVHRILGERKRAKARSAPPN